MGAEGPPSERLPELLARKGTQEFLAASCEVSAHRPTSGVGCAVGVPTFVTKHHSHMEKPDNPEVLAVVPLPSAEGRWRREIMLARLMLVMVDIILSGEPLGLRHCYPDLMDEFL